MHMLRIDTFNMFSECKGGNSIIWRNGAVVEYVLKCLDLYSSFQHFWNARMGRWRGENAEKWRPVKLYSVFVLWPLQFSFFYSVFCSLQCSILYFFFWISCNFVCFVFLWFFHLRMGRCRGENAEKWRPLRLDFATVAKRSSCPRTGFLFVPPFFFVPFFLLFRCASISST